MKGSHKRTVTAVAVGYFHNTALGAVRCRCYLAPSSINKNQNRHATIAHFTLTLPWPQTKRKHFPKCRSNGGLSSALRVCGAYLQQPHERSKTRLHIWYVHKCGFTDWILRTMFRSSCKTELHNMKYCKNATQIKVNECSRLSQGLKRFVDQLWLDKRMSNTSRSQQIVQSLSFACFFFK